MDIKHKPPKLPRVFYLIVFLIAVGGESILWALCLNFIDKQEPRLTVFFPLAINYLILTVIFVQVYIYQRQWEAMQQSLRIAEDNLAHSKETLNASKRAYLAIGPINIVGTLIGGVP